MPCHQCAIVCQNMETNSLTASPYQDWASVAVEFKPKNKIKSCAINLLLYCWRFDAPKPVSISLQRRVHALVSNEKIVGRMEYKRMDFSINEFRFGFCAHSMGMSISIVHGNQKTCNRKSVVRVIGKTTGPILVRSLARNWYTIANDIGLLSLAFVGLNSMQEFQLKKTICKRYVMAEIYERQKCVRHECVVDFIGCVFYTHQTNNE